jgi:hypothetical protein
MDRVARAIVVGLAGFAAIFFFVVFVKLAFFHVHSPSEHPMEHEWDPVLWAMLLALGGLFTGIALSAAFRWRWWVRAIVVLLAPFATIGTVYALALLAEFLRQ